VKSILKLCQAVEEQAKEVYDGLARQASDPELVQLWGELAAEEGRHREHWQMLLRSAERGQVPSLFPNEEEVEAELRSVLTRIASLRAGLDSSSSTAWAFVLGLRVQFQLLQPTLEYLLQWAQRLGGEPEPQLNSEQSLVRLVAAVRRGGAGPELDLACEMLVALQRQNQQLLLQSHRDALTGVRNRRGFLDTVFPLCHLAQRSGQTVAFLMLDLDDFKRVNDEHGHAQGDEVLRAVARILQGSMRQSDVLGRHGGDQFIVFLSPVVAGAVAAVGEKMRLAVEQATAAEHPVTVSVGGASGMLGRDVQRDVDKLLARVDACLFIARSTGRNRVVVQE
jgi:diguanylate cyclase (GGDEF)-like protein